MERKNRVLPSSRICSMYLENGWLNLVQIFDEYLLVVASGCFYSEEKIAEDFGERWLSQAFGVGERA